MNNSWRVLTWSLALAACNGSSGREPADQNDAAQQTQDAAADAARDAASIDARAVANDASTLPDASEQADADAGGMDATMAQRELETFVYIGGWGNSYDVKTFTLDRASGALTQRDSKSGFGDSPSFIAPSRDGKLLYLTNESGSGVTIASIDPATGVPTRIEKRNDTGGKGLVHASIAPNGRYLLAADYNGGRLVQFPIAADGKLGAASNTVSFGNTAQTHSSGVHPAGTFAYAPNKGLDVIGQFAIDAATNTMTKLADFETESEGPRMISISADGKFAYVVFEEGATVEAYSIGSNGLLAKIDEERIGTDPGNQGGSGAHVLLHPQGKFLYTSERSSNNIAVFAVGTDGKLSKLADVPSEGRKPRCFDIDATGKWLLLANQGENDSSFVGNLVAFEIGSDGKLTRRGTPITGLKAPTAVSLVTRPRP